MDFSLTEDQRMLQQRVRDFASNELEPVAAQIDESEEFPGENIKKMGELGLFACYPIYKLGAEEQKRRFVVLAGERSWPVLL